MRGKIASERGKAKKRVRRRKSMRAKKHQKKRVQSHPKVRKSAKVRSTRLRRVRQPQQQPGPKWIPSSRYDWMFYAPSPDAKLTLERDVWRRLRQELPFGYAIPDRNFLAIVRNKSGLEVV
jgi:hypothetical protein